MERKLPSRAERMVMGLLQEVGASQAYGLGLVRASRGALTKGGVYTLLQRLEAKGLVSRSGKAENLALWAITDVGERVLRNLEELDEL